MKTAGVTSRILVADDYEDAARSIAQLLELYGHEVVVAFDGITAFERALALRPHVALLDLELPNLDGYQLARCMRTHPALCNTRLICLTGRVLEADERRARSFGFDQFLTKPVDIRGLIDVIDAVPHGVAY